MDTELAGRLGSARILSRGLDLRCADLPAEVVQLLLRDIRETLDRNHCPEPIDGDASGRLLRPCRHEVNAQACAPWQRF